FWNFYAAYTGVGFPITQGALTNLLLADGTLTSVGLTISNTFVVSSSGSLDPMYGNFVSSRSSMPVLVTNLPTGWDDIYLYSPNGNFDVAVGITDYGVKTTFDLSLSQAGVFPNWQEGVQYVRVPGVFVNNPGSPLTITALSSPTNFATLAGLQIATGTAQT